MKEETLLLYKLMILYMLNQVEFPLTTTSLSDFFVKGGYTGYFQMQQSINELVEGEYIVDKEINHSTNYSITPAGQEVLSLFGSRVSRMLKEDIMTFLTENKYDLRKEVEITADYYLSSDSDYIVNAKICEKGSMLLEINVNVVSEQQALTMCERWSKNSNEVYGKIMELLLL